MRLQLLFILLGIVQFLVAQTDSRQQEQQADLLTRQASFEAANQLYSQLIKQYQEQGKQENLFRVRTKKAINALATEDYLIAIDLLHKAINQKETTAIADTLLAVAYHKLGVAYYYEEIDSAAIENYQLSLAYKERIYPKNHVKIIKTYRNIGTSYYYLEQFKEAIHFQQHALDLHLSAPILDTILLAQTHKDLGAALTKEEDFKPATRHLERALNLFLSKEAEVELLVEIYQNLWKLYKYQMDSKNMHRYAIAALTVLTSWSGEDKFQQSMLADTYNDLGITYEIKQTLDTALIYYKNAITINLSLLEREEELAKNHSNISIVYKELGQYENALIHVNKAIQFDKSLGASFSGLAENLNNKASILVAMERFEEAITIHQEALTFIAPKFNPTNQYEVPSPTSFLRVTKPSFADFLTDKADALQLKYKKSTNQADLKAAVATYDTIALLINEIRLSFESDASKSFLATKAHPIFEQAIATTVALYKITKEDEVLHKIFQLIEQSKSMIVLDALAEANAAENAGIPKELIAKEKQLKLAISQAEKTIQLGLVQSTAPQNSLTKFNRQLDLLQDSLKKYSKYAELKYHTAIVQLTDLQLTSKQTMINYFVGTKRIYAFIVGPNGNKLIDMPKDALLDEGIKQLQHKISNKDTLSTVSYQLYNQIFAPIAQQYELTEELIIIPDGILGYLPFDLLISQPVQDTTPFHHYPYLIKQYQISYRYSATLFRELFQKEYPPERGNIIAFAPIFIGNNQVAISSTRSFILEPLRHNISEVEAIQENITTTTLKAKEATKANFLKYAKGYKVVHLSTHAKADEQQGGYAYLAFTSVSDNIEHSILYNQELYNLQLPVDLVVMSACETGIGELQKGEGIISLARGFSYAGAKSIVTTLWSIEDEKTKEVMVSFYTYLKSGYTKDKALRQAKLEYLKEHEADAHPFYWAAFIPIGAMDAIEFSEKSNSYPFLFMMLFVLLIGAYRLIKSNQPKTS